MKIPVVQRILNANDQIAAENKARFDAAGVFVLNVMASPGAGKTSLILATVPRLSPEVKVGVIEGDLASTIDADRIAADGIAVVQVNTGGACHLDALMVRSALEQLPLAELNLIFIENVGNLVCPANFRLGTHLSVVVSSVPEGQDKPYKYPGMFAGADVVLLNKMDLLPYFDFDMEYFRRGLEILHPDIPFFLISCRTGEGIEEWGQWLLQRSGLMGDVDKKQLT
ncbi:MAG: hydrogenase nickel incorporation protein HypB [bacterium]|nr:hydrogenase nickel incorporation protein HypB [bacterium]